MNKEKGRGSPIPWTKLHNIVLDLDSDPFDCRLMRGREIICTTAWLDTVVLNTVNRILIDTFSLACRDCGFKAAQILQILIGIIISDIPLVIVESFDSVVCPLKESKMSSRMPEALGRSETTESRRQAPNWNARSFHSATEEEADASKAFEDQVRMRDAGWLHILRWKVALQRRSPQPTYRIFYRNAGHENLQFNT